MTTQREGTGVATRPVLLLGSVPLGSASEVFEQVGGRLGHAIRAVPDGETGERLAFILWLVDQWRGKEGLEVVHEFQFDDPVTGGPRNVSFFGLVDGVQAGDVEWEPFGYSEFALQSYASFAEARRNGSIPDDVRFQVSLPTALGLALLFPKDRDQVLPHIERALANEVARVSSAIPPTDLAIQWDAPGEIMGLERVRQAGPGADPEAWPLELATTSIARLAKDIPSDVLVGVHLCYGDPDGHHPIEPRDMSVMVDVANSLFETVQRRLDYVHMPVPIDRDDDAYFAALDDLRLPPETTLYLGLVHLEDGLPGAERRANAAQKRIASFGVAAECGLGRERRSDVPALLDLHRQVAHLGAGEQ